MSKDIWHKADETPKAERYFIEHYKVVVGDKVYWKYGLFKGVSNYDYPFDQDTARWCYLDDLLALEGELEQSEICCTEWEKQALDYKAENIALSGDLERTRKALETLQEFVTKLYLNGNITDEQLERYKKILITALEQKD